MNESWEAFDNHFRELEDPRATVNRRHQMLDMLVITICAVLCGADDWEAVAEFGRAEKEWFARFLPLPSGIPSHDTFWRLLRRLDGAQFEAYFLRWVAEVAELNEGEVVAIDGKRVRRSHDREAERVASMLVSAWATENRLTLGQGQVAEKSNEIKTIPQLLLVLDLTDCIITIDAIGCQKEIAAQIVAAEADYVLALKQHQGSLYEDVPFLFEDLRESKFTAFPFDSVREVDKGHGRIEVRQCWTIDDPTLLPHLRGALDWPALQSRVWIRAQRIQNEERSGGFWGAMQEFCAAGGVCTKQAYDAFGRASHRWERGIGYPDRDEAQMQWRYYPWGSMGQNANVVVIQSQPRCEGNFVRKLYDGFGQLIQEQTPRQGWQTRLGGCSDVENALETVVDYVYDGFGRLRRTSVPRSVSFAWRHEPNWDAGFTATSYDALGRPASTHAANGVVTSYHYNGLTASVTGGGEGGDARRLLSWQQQDQLGRTTLLRTYTPGDNEWTLEAGISLTYDGADRLTQVYRRDAGERRWQRTSSIHYDLAGRKTGMSDADLGSWRYDYNALGQLTRQTDARDKTSCLYYDSLGRMRGRVLRTDENCAATVADADLDSAYSYDPQGRVQRVANDSVSRSFSYDSYSRLNSESVTVDSLTRTTSYGYDNYHRPTTVTYHGGEVVTTRYGSPGAAVGLSSSAHGTLVDSVSYDEAGRMTALRLPAGR